MSGSFERALAFDECAVFVQAHVHTWSEMQDSPLKALATGIGSCAATAAIATQFLALREIPTNFGYSRLHGEINGRDGEAIVGHALAASAVTVRGVNRVLESRADATCRSRQLELSELHMKYHIGSPQEMLDRYHATMTGEPAESLDEVRSEIESRIGARAILL